ncbi:MAG: efflux RND transporter periplasmic adaptor subunit, partial [Planctomycetes bacterium]|nr:efflux RND transporter periplasmic adaptor subunit [Planctomycetota bacterium]
MMKQAMPRLVALALLPLLALLCSCDEKAAGGSHGSAGMAQAGADGPAKGPHGGRLLSEGEFEVEVTIFERGVPPEFRVYAYQSKKPLDPADVVLSIEVHRLGGRVDKIAFQKEGDFLRGDKEVYEPHSFDVKVAAEWKGKAYRLGYSQAEARTEMGPEARKSSGVEIEESGPVKMKSILELSGEIALNPDKVAHVVPRFDGVVTEIRKNLGDKVTRGEVIALLDSRELASAKLEYIQDMHKEEFAKASFDREEQLWKKKISSEEEYLLKRHALELAKVAVHGSGQKLRALGLLAAEIKTLAENHDSDKRDENLARYELRAPQDGVVIAKNVALGEAVKDDTDIFTIADLGTVLAKVTVYDKDLKFVRVDQEVLVKSDTLGIEARGKVAYLGPLIGKETRAATAHLEIPNPEGLWRPGLFIAVHLVQEEFTVPVAVRV